MDTPRGYRLYHGLAMVFIGMLIIANTIAVKVVDIAGFMLPAGIICFPITYIFGDVLTEVYGYARTRSIIWWGFGILGLMSVLYVVAVALPPAPFFGDQDAFSRLFGFVPRIVLASLIAYLIGSFLNAFVMSWMKLKTGGKRLWMRTIGSTIVGEGVDSLVFNIIAFIGVFQFGEVMFIAFSGFVLKTAYEVIATPLTYLVVNVVKRYEGIDQFDHGVSYNPFKTSSSDDARKEVAA